MAADAPGEGGSFQRAAGGDGEAIGSLLARHAAAIRRAIARDLPKRHRAVLGEDDVLQQTWVDAFHDFGAFARAISGSGVAQEGEAADAALGAWLRTVARRNLLDALRMLDADKRGGRGPRSRHHDLLDSLTDGRLSRSPSRTVALGETRAALERALSSLPDAYRAVVTGYDIEGRPMQEVANGMGRSRGAAFMLRARALRLLRGAMGSTSKYFSSGA